MMKHLAYAVQNISLDDSLLNLILYHYFKDEAQKHYFAMMQSDRKELYGLMIL